ncbi:MAG TPA: 5-formyltetrahydrofolate cyclo-ligase [Steroidobacteraceae bacterium]|jgi:5-formyltetrahydrofolate cyclo-ligase|nr:5-formyltetrahydrofolate cyclo-ligase [Steroidobacteraceae bacterium]
MKRSLRKELRARRRALSPADHARRSRLAAKAVTALPEFRAGKRIAVYLPFDRETDTSWLIEAAERRGIQVFVPVISDLRHARMRFHAHDGATRPGTFGIEVPADFVRTVAPRWLDLIVVPLVGVDARGGRLGMGLGFYDRALGFRRHRRWRGPRVVGLAFDCQRTDAAFADPWDLRLDSLATESGLLHFPPRRHA